MVLYTPHHHKRWSELSTSFYIIKSCVLQNKSWTNEQLIWWLINHLEKTFLLILFLFLLLLFFLFLLFLLGIVISLRRRRALLLLLLDWLLRRWCSSSSSLLELLLVRTRFFLLFCYGSCWAWRGDTGPACQAWGGGASVPGILFWLNWLCNYL